MPSRTQGQVSGQSAKTISALAQTPTPTTASEVNQLYMSMRGVCDQLAMVIDQHAILLQRELSRGAEGGNLMDRATARRRARQATAPLRQAADRVRGGGSSVSAAWARFTRLYADLIKPPSRRRAFQFDR